MRNYDEFLAGVRRLAIGPGDVLLFETDRTDAALLHDMLSVKRVIESNIRGSITLFAMRKGDRFETMTDGALERVKFEIEGVLRRRKKRKAKA